MRMRAGRRNAPLVDWTDKKASGWLRQPPRWLHGDLTPKSVLLHRYAQVTGCSHEKKHGDREHKVDSRGQKRLAAERGHLCRGWLAGFRCLFGHSDDFLLTGPDYRVHIDHHDETKQTSQPGGFVARPGGAWMQHDEKHDSGEHRHGRAVPEPVQ